jgi:hypothetical protein
VDLFQPDRIAELRVDHVPAEQLGGDRLVLSCEPCNSNSGAIFQSEMKKRDNPAAALRGELPRPHPVRVTLSTGATINAVLSGGPDGGHRIEVVERANSKAAQNLFTQQLQAAARSGSTDWSVNLDFPRDRHHSVAAHVGWLREAYLVAFAVLGYRYILDPALNSVREQLAQPREELIPVFTIQSPEKSPSERKFLGVTEPEWLRSVAVQFGRRTVFLPQIGDPGIYGRLSQRRKPGQERLEEAHAGGWTVEWPREPMFLLDFQLAQPVFQRKVSDGAIT